MLGKQQAINQQPQLGIRKIPLQIEIGENITGFLFALLIDVGACNIILALNGLIGFHQICQITGNGFTVSSHIIIRPKIIHDLLLTQRMFRICVSLQDIQDVHHNHFLCRCGLCHFNHLVFSVSCLTPYYNTRCGISAPSGVFFE